MTEWLRRSMLVAMLVVSTIGLGAIARTQPERPDITTLVAATSSARGGFAATALVGAIASDEVLAWQGSQLANLTLANGVVAERRTGTTLQFVNGPHAVAVERRGRIVAAVRSTAQLFDSSGKAIRSFPIPFSESIASLPSGDFAVASPTVNGLIHVYSQFGAQRGHFGGLKDLDTDRRENAFLNRGIVLAGPDDTYLYVFANSPRPTVQQFRKDGTELFEFEISGASLNAHLADARRFLSTRSPEDVGGIKPILAADFAPTRGTILIATTARQTGWESVYEYTLSGTKVAEYRLTLRDGTPIERLTDLVVRDDRIVLTGDDGRLHEFNLPVRTVFERPVRIVRSGMGHLQNLATRLFPPASAMEPCRTYVAVNACQTGQCNIGGTRDCRNVICNIGNCNKAVAVDCEYTATSCSLKITECTEEPPGHAVDVNVGPAALACPTDVDQDGWSPEMGDCEDEDPGINPGVTFGSCEGTSPGDLNCNNIPDTSECYTPIAIDVNGDGFSFTNKANGVMFDLIGSGVAQQFSWTTTNDDDVWLAMDRNGNGRIDSGKELWGAPTEQPPSHSRNGYIALAEYDLPVNGGNDDEIIDREDAVFAKLLLWRDVNHDGVSQSSEITALSGSSIESIDLNYREHIDYDSHGNWFRYKSPANVGLPQFMSRTTCDVFLWAK
jgi:hypothetical protein